MCGAEWSRAAALHVEATQELQEHVAVADKNVKRAHQRIKYHRDVLTGRLIKTRLRYSDHVVVFPSC